MALKNVFHSVGALLITAALASCTEGDLIPGVDAGRGDAGTSTATRSIRGKVPVRAGARRITRVNVIDARTGRTIGTGIPDAAGNFNVANIPKGATYKLSFVAGARAIPLVFPKARGNAAAKTNLFKIGNRASRTGNLDGPIDVGEVTSSMEGGEEQLTPMNADQAPNMQEDFDEDGMPDAADSDVDGDGTPNAMDMDNDGDDMPDNAQYGDQDGDGITNEADPDMDGDGTANAMDTDNDNDGTPDAMDTTPNGNTVGTSEDSDGDGIPNGEDTSDPDDNEAPPPDMPFEGCTDSEYVNAHPEWPHWEYEAAMGWSGLMGEDGGTPFATCAGMMMQQTPVAIPGADGTFTAEENALTYENYGMVPLRIVNNGHTVQVNVAESGQPCSATRPSVVIGGTRYCLVQFHGHSQSEHTVGGQQLPMEWHFVHSTTNNLTDASASIVVVGVFFNTPEGATANPALQSVLDRAPRNELNRACAATMVDLGALFPENRSYYHYSPGSLTTPPCSKGLNWFVLSTPVGTTAAQATRLLERIGGHENARPVQPLGARTIYRYTQPAMP